jgi:oxygen-independent coproporphyrinogen-3 oxidase
VGFENINLDLMFGLPEQTIDLAINDIRTACDFNPQHISHYQLTIEANTLFHSKPPALPETDLIWEMQTQCHDILSNKGLNQYEVSAFAKDTYQCKHNLNYWMFGDYIGIGAGAHGKVTDNTTNSISRRWKRRQPEDYMKNALAGNALSDEACLDKTAIISEFLLNVLRLRKGVPIATFENTTGLKKDNLLKTCESVEAELLTIDDDRIRASDKGYRFLNNVLEKIV